MHRQRSRLQPGRLSESLFQSGSKFKVPGSTSLPQPGTRNSEPETPKVKHGTTDQYYRLVFSVLDALRFDRDWRGSARTVALCSDGASSLYRATSAGLFESWHSRHARTLGDFVQRLTLWLKITLHQVRVPAA